MGMGRGILKGSGNIPIGAVHWWKEGIPDYLKSIIHIIVHFSKCAPIVQTLYYNFYIGELSIEYINPYSSFFFFVCLAELFCHIH